MTVEIKVPMLPESVVDATISQWHKQVGEYVEEGENIVDLETDKVMLEVPSTESGVIQSIHAQAGEKVEAQQLLVTIDNDVTEITDKPVVTEADVNVKSESHVASPSVRRTLTTHSLEIDQVKASGKGGRVTKEDVQEHLEQKTESQISAPNIGVSGNREIRREKMTRIRSKIAERLLEVQQQTAMLTTFNEVNMQPIIDLRAKYKEAFQQKHGVKLGFMSFFVESVTQALKQFPRVNATIEEQDVLYYNYYDVGVAVSTDRGLMVPILRDTDQMTLAQIEQSIIDLAQKARSNKMTIEDMQGGTFTITNGGIFGSMLSTPILNAPQSAILGMHNITKRAVVEDDTIVIRPMMYLALTYDHRIIDGEQSVKFLLMIKQLLEDPARFLLGI